MRITPRMVRAKREWAGKRCALDDALDRARTDPEVQALRAESKALLAEVDRTIDTERPDPSDENHPVWSLSRRAYALSDRATERVIALTTTERDACVDAWKRYETVRAEEQTSA